MKRKQAHPPQSQMAKVQSEWQRFMQEHGILGPFDYAARARAEQEARRLFHDTVSTHRTYHPDDGAAAIIELGRRQYEQVLDAAYPPGFWEDYERLRAGDAAGLESAVAFLEADPLFFRSGYVKQKLIQAIKPRFMTPEYARRLRNAVLSLVDRRDDRDFRAFCRLARKEDSPELRQELTRRLSADGADVRRRARWMLAALPPSE